MEWFLDIINRIDLTNPFVAAAVTIPATILLKIIYTYIRKKLHFGGELSVVAKPIMTLLLQKDKWANHYDQIKYSGTSVTGNVVVQLPTRHSCFEVYVAALDVTDQLTRYDKRILKRHARAIYAGNQARVKAAAIAKTLTELDRIIRNS